MATYSFWQKPSYEFNLSNTTSFTVGASHEVSASVSNEAKLALGTEISGGLSSSIKIGPEIEFKHPLTNSYEIDLEAEHVTDTTADTANFYNATQFRATAGELAATPLNQIDDALTKKAKRVAYVALVLQLAATSMTMATAIKGAPDEELEESERTSAWTATQNDYWGSWTTAIVDGCSLVSLATAFIAACFIDGSKRKTPERHKNFLNMNKNTGVMVGVQSTNMGFGSGSWYLQNQSSVEIGCHDDMGFNAALTDREFNPVAAPDKATAGRLFISYGGVELRGGNGSISNIVPKGEFTVQVGKVVNPRLQLDSNNSFVRRPDAAGANYGLEMQSGCVKLSLDAETDLDLGTGGMVRLRKGAGTSLALASSEATLTATTINLAATAVNINGADFKTGLVTIGDLQAVITDMSALATRTEEIADNSARAVASVAGDAARRAEAVADQVAEVALQVQVELERMTAEFESQTEYLVDQIKRLKRR